MFNKFYRNAFWYCFSAEKPAPQNNGKKSLEEKQKCGAAKKAADAKCGADKKAADAKCGADKKAADAKCGAAK